MRHSDRNATIAFHARISSSLFPTPYSLLLYRRPNRLLLVWVQFGIGGLQVRLVVHPLVQSRPLEPPPVPQLEGRNKRLRSVLVQGVRGDAKVVGGLANVHALAHLGNQQVGTGRGTTHNRLLTRALAQGIFRQSCRLSCI